MQQPIAMFVSVVLSTCALVAPLSPGQTVESGRFGRALKLGESSYAMADYNPIYYVAPLTVEMWAKVPSKETTSILINNQPQRSVEHWHVFVEAGTGALCVSFPGYRPAEVKSKLDIADNKWHYLAMIFDAKTVKLYVDAKEVASEPVLINGHTPDTGPIVFGYMDGKAAAAGTVIDEIRLSSVARPMGRVPDAPFTNDHDTTALWHFDEDAKMYDKTAYADQSINRNPARIETLSKDVPDNGGFDGTRGEKTRWSDMDYGSFFSSSLIIPKDKQNFTAKAISIRLGKDRKNSIAFDTELLRVSATWSGNFIKIPAKREGLSGPPDLAGTIQFATKAGPGWAKPGSEDFTDPRPDKLGPLPIEWGHYKGLYTHGDRVVLSYSVGDCDILESPSVEETAGHSTFVRSFEVTASSQKLLLRVSDFAKGKPEPTVRLVGGPAGSAVENGAMSINISLPAHEGKVRFTLYISTDPQPKDAPSTDALNLSELTKGGPARFPIPIVTKGVVGTPAPKSDGAYVVDTLTAPDDNPWKSFLRFGGIDFFKNGDAVVCSVSGDVWVVSGIDDTLQNLKWRRYATGLFQALGLKVIDDVVYVLGRDQITRLHDLNHDGEADFYENFNNDGKVTNKGHAYTTNLETDPAGNFYYAKSGDATAHGGSVLKVSKDGSKLEVVAVGIRNTNGLGVSPDGVLTHADNEGEWVPASRIDIVHPGDFLGFVPSSHTITPPTDPGKPIVWMPQDVDNSAGSQVWVTSDTWGLPRGSMLHTSYGAASLLYVMPETIDGQTQAGVWRFPFTFDSGIMRGRFNPIDGQLYVCGLRGWQTRGTRDGALQRVRFTGKPAHMPLELHAHQNGLHIAFTCPLDKETASDVSSYSVLQWNYRWSNAYGSPHLSVKNPEKQGHDILTIKSAKLLPDGKSVFLEISDFKPSMQVKISLNLNAADGTEMKQDIHSTMYGMNPAIAP